MSIDEQSMAEQPGERGLTRGQRLWAPAWARAQRRSITRRCIMCGALVGVRPPDESPQYCSDGCRDVHYSCGG